jgi:CheY-like chemotaxis protein
MHSYSSGPFFNFAEKMRMRASTIRVSSLASGVARLRFSGAGDPWRRLLERGSRRYLDSLRPRKPSQVFYPPHGSRLKGRYRMSDYAHKTLLRVEDEAIIAMAERKTLEKRGFTVIVSHTGEEAIETVRKNPTVDLVLMDIDLGGGITGDQAAEQILHLPIVFLTSHTEEEYVKRVKQITRYRYVLKNRASSC